MMNDEIDIDAFEKFIEENPLHMSPKEALNAIFDYLPEDDPCLIEATHLLEKWEGTPTLLEQQRAEAEFVFLKWNFRMNSNDAPHTQ